MATSDPQVCVIDVDEESDYVTEEEDSEDDPTFDILEETRSSLSKLSIKKSKPRVSEKIVSDSKRELDYDVPELNPIDQKSFENVEKIIQAGDLEKLKIDQCKVYLRKHGLRLTGTKNILIERIREHLGVIDGGGKAKYPASSFVVNCKGDACTGDVVMFEQNVYEMYNIASRSASGPPCGTRTVAGRIVKESYGAAKQQHTFTIEVLWSKGMKPLPPLHPLLIKGRNLYRLKTMRRVWIDEEERRKILLEKHSRGCLARSNRETRIQEKEMRKVHKGKREMQKILSGTKGGQNNYSQPNGPNPTKPSLSLQQIVQPGQSAKLPPFDQQKPAEQPVETRPNHIRPQNFNDFEQKIRKLQNPIGTMSQWKEYDGSRVTGVGSYPSMKSPPRTQNHTHQFVGIIGSYPIMKSPPRAHNSGHHFVGRDHQFQVQSYRKENVPPPMNMRSLNSQPRSPLRWAGPMPMQQQQQQRQVCRHYAHGRCHFGDRCKFLHERPESHQQHNNINCYNYL